MSNFTLTDDGGAIAAVGSYNDIYPLQAVPGCQISVGATRSVARMPPTRTSVMVVESAVPMFQADDGYLALRRLAMSPTREEMDRWMSVCRTRRTLLQFQHDFNAFALDLRGAFNASEQGTGKTTMSCSLIGAWRRMHGYTRVLIVSPKSPMMQWEGELWEVLGEDAPLFLPLVGDVRKRLEVLEGLRGMPDYMAVATNYEALDRLQLPIARFRPHVVIFDESWKIKTPSAAMTKAAVNIADCADRVLCLNGTPISNHVGDLWSQLRVVMGRRSQLGTYKQWMEDFAVSNSLQVQTARGTASVTQYVGVKNVAGMVMRMAPVYWRATKESCLDLPEKMAPREIECRMAPEQSALYGEIMDMGESAFYPGAASGDPFGEEWDDASFAIEGLTPEQTANLSLAGAVTKVLRLQQVAAGFMPPRLTYGIPFDGAARGLRLDQDTGAYDVGSPKDAEIEAWLDDNMRYDRTVRGILWCRFKPELLRMHRLAERVLGRGATAMVYGGRGGIKDTALKDVKESFNSRSQSGVRLLVANKRMAYGHNLQACDWNLQTSLPWSFLEQDQLEDRSHRLGRHGPVGYLRFMAMRQTRRGQWGPTVDHDVRDAIAARENMMARIARHTTAMEGRDGDNSQAA